VGEIKKVLKLLLRGLGWLFYAGMTLWCFGAAWYSNLPWHWLRVTCAVVVVGLLICGVLLRKRKGLWGAAGIMAAVAVWFMLIPATNDRPWLPSFARNPYAVFSPDGSEVTIHDIRDFDYRAEHDFTVRYITGTCKLDELRSMDYIQVHWDGMEAIAHSMLSFGFADGRHLTVSVETRLAEGDVQGALPGLYKCFGLLMILGTERDLLGLRTNYRHEQVYLYPTGCNREQVRTVFLDILRRVNELREEPQFYNTIRHNCFTSLIPSLKLIMPQMRRDISMLFNGLTDKRIYEYELAKGKFHDGSYQDFRQLHYVNPKVDRLPELPTANEYSGLIRRPPGK
jgi:hypothetical protein